MRKILFIAPINTHSRFKGGISSYASSIIDNSLLFENNNVDFIPFDNCFVDRKAGTNGKVTFSNFLNFIKTRKQLSKVIKKGNYDAIYLNTSYGVALLKDLLTIKKRSTKRIKVILHIHFAGYNDVFSRKRIIKKMILNNINRKVTHIISLSEEFKKELITQGFNDSKISVLYNYYDPQLPQIDIKSIEKKYSSKPGVINFLFVGSLDKRKGIYDLINVFENIHEQKNIKLTICGKPNDSESFALINDLDKSLFDYKGYVSGDAKNEVYIKSNVLVLPSYGEGLPITILEALHFGLPVLSTNVGAIPEVVDNNVGILFNPGDLNEMKKRILWFANDCNLLEMSKNSIKKSALFSFNNFSLQLLKIIESVLPNNDYSKKK